MGRVAAEIQSCKKKNEKVNMSLIREIKEGAGIVIAPSDKPTVIAIHKIRKRCVKLRVDGVSEVEGVGYDCAENVKTLKEKIEHNEN